MCPSDEHPLQPNYLSHHHLPPLARSGSMHHTHPYKRSPIGTVASRSKCWRKEEKETEGAMMLAAMIRSTAGRDRREVVTWTSQCVVSSTSSSQSSSTLSLSPSSSHRTSSSHRISSTSSSQSSSTLSLSSSLLPSSISSPTYSVRQEEDEGK